MRILPIVLSACMCTSAIADVVHLTDGGNVEGDVTKGTSGYVVNFGDGKFRVIPFNQVKSIELTRSQTAPADLARVNLASLRRTVEHLDDIDAIISRYQRFIAANAGTPSSAEAKKDLDLWQQRKSVGLVKFGSQWVTLPQRTALREQAIATIDQARRLIRQGRLTEAGIIVKQAVDDDPKNASALYLQGLLQFRQNQSLPAKKSFEAVNALVPNHGPTLNNLAVVQWSLKQTNAALASYDQAMLSSPKNPQILNNVAEALNALPPSLRDSAAARRIAQRFAEQDADLQKELDPQGLHRWGATWVSTDQLKQLQAADQRIKDRLDALAVQFDSGKASLDRIDQEIDDNTRALHRIEAVSYVRDYSGATYPTALPATYYQLQDDTRKLQRDRSAQFTQLDGIRQQARALSQDLSAGKFAGVQRLIDVEGTPAMIPDQAPTPSPMTPVPTTAP